MLLVPEENMVRHGKQLLPCSFIITDYASADIQHVSARHEPGEESGPCTAGHSGDIDSLELLLASLAASALRSHGLYNLPASEAIPLGIRIHSELGLFGWITWQ
jgi:hypothetical protein